MRYNLDDLHWQEFEVIAFKIIQILVADDVQFVEGGGDKGRDVIHRGVSKIFKTNWSGDWVFQCKHKSKQIDSKKLQIELVKDLRSELEKVFVKNQLRYDNYILVTNKPISGNLFDVLNKTFDEVTKKNDIQCSNFEIISYRHIESCVDQNENLKWIYPNILSHPDFKVLLETQTLKVFNNRNEGWLRQIEDQRCKFVYTQFYERALSKLERYPAIILSGPPKSGKTFNAEILALNYRVIRGFQAILIDDPDDIEKTYHSDRKQIFICDDAFGKHLIALRVENWLRKFRRVIGLSDKNHLFVFISREYIFRAFQNYGGADEKKLLEKILVESHDYALEEKLAILKRYVILSSISDYDKKTVLNNEESLAKHRNFSPETIRAFFANLDKTFNDCQLEKLVAHLREPDAYLKAVFYNLTEEKQAVLLSVLCAVDNREDTIFSSFKTICDDLQIYSILNSGLEFEELDDSILRIRRSDKIEEVKYYHPSMEEFLIRELTKNPTSRIRETVLKNINISLLSVARMRSEKENIKLSEDGHVIDLYRNDLAAISIGLNRLSNNSFTSFAKIIETLTWFKHDSNTLNLKVNDPPSYRRLREILNKLTKYTSTRDFYDYHLEEGNSTWGSFFETLNYLSVSYGISFERENFEYIEELLDHKKESPLYWRLVFGCISISDDSFIKDTVGKDWLNNFFIELKNDINQLGYEIYGNDFPDFNTYKKEKNKNPTLKKMKNKPNSSWYPRFLMVREKFEALKSNKGKQICSIIIERLLKPYNELQGIAKYAQNRHTFNVDKGWWS
ncbi:MAG: hypothetical protein DHS20C13_27610 [Thermodesulfobacteriota bacterium]|nr:MAG: hypothetical protein DHS20C13_27610 [Thermodesulfobacteriota bacterium]GJM36566.1 MAG: hypothetical protein DHS20C18_55670 [Saprospiraceae bacterium]